MITILEWVGLCFECYGFPFSLNPFHPYRLDSITKSYLILFVKHLNNDLAMSICSLEGWAVTP